MICGKCGTDNAEGAKVCVKCGAPLVSSADTDFDKMIEDTIADGDDIDILSATGQVKSASKGGDASLSTESVGTPMVARSMGGSPLYAAPTVSSTSDIPFETPADSVPASPVASASIAGKAKAKATDRGKPSASDDGKGVLADKGASTDVSSTEIVNQRTPKSRNSDETTISESFAAWGRQIKKNHEYSGSEKRLNEVNTKLEANQKEYDRLNDIVARYPDNLKAQKNQLSALEGRAKKAAENARNIRATVNTDSSTLMNLTESHVTQLGPLERDVATLTTAYQSAQAKLEVARKAKKDAEENLKNYRSDYVSAEKNLRKRDEQIESRQADLAKLSLGDDGYDALQKEINELTLERERFSSEMAGSEFKIQSANDTAAERDKTLLAEEQATAEARSAYESATKALENQRKSFTEDEKVLKEKIASLEKDFTAENENVAKTQKEIAACNKTIAEIEDIYANRDTYIPNLIKNIDVAKRQAESHTTNMSQIDEEKQAARAESRKAKLLVALIIAILIVIVVLIVVLGMNA